MDTKDKLLSVLIKNEGKAVSGATIAKELNISRNAVWKAVNALKNEGCEIEAGTNKGYRLIKTPDKLSLGGIYPFLADKNCDIEVYETIKSTNDTAKEKAMQGAKHGTVIISDVQSGGRGRYGRSFYSPPGCGIYISFIVKPEEGRPNTELATIFAAVAVCAAIENICGKSPQIKWVNDDFLNEKKICGILTEAVTDLETMTPQWLVIGIGINFLKTDLPKELEGIVGSVFEENPTVSRNKLAAELINQILFRKYSNEEIIEEYRKRLFILGKIIRVESTQAPYEAKAVDIDNMGRLIVEKPNRERVLLSSGEVSVRL